MSIMPFKLVLLKDNKVVWEMPLFTKEWIKDELDEELEELENEFDRISKIFDALSNKNRLMMMKSLIGEEDILHFSDLMRELRMNPKIVRESAIKLKSGGLLEQPDRGEYQCSRIGQVSFFTLPLVLRRLLKTLDEIDEEMI